MSGSGATVVDLVQIVDTFGSAGSFRVLIGAGTSNFDGTWGSLSGKPSTFAPSAHTHPTSEVTGLDAALAAKAADSGVVHNTGAETVAGVKTFSSQIIFSNGTLTTSAPALNVSQTWNGTTSVAFVGASINITKTGPNVCADGSSLFAVNNTGSNAFSVRTMNSGGGDGVKVVFHRFATYGVAIPGNGSYMQIYRDGGTAVTLNQSSVDVNAMFAAGVYTFATLPSASSNTGRILRISDRSQRYAYSDGTNWRFISDDTIVS